MAKKTTTKSGKGSVKKLSEKEYSLACSKLSETHLKGKSHWCELENRQIQAPVCNNTQKTAGCTIGPANTSTQTGCSCWDGALNEMANKKTRKRNKKSSGPAKNSYQTIMAAYFQKNGFADIHQLVDAINTDPTRQEVKRPADEKNTSVGISILRNSTRVKNPLRIQYSRITKLYYFLDSDIGKKKYDADMIQVEADKKAKKSEKKSEPVKTEVVVEKEPKKKAPAKKGKAKGKKK